MLMYKPWSVYLNNLEKTELIIMEPQHISYGHGDIFLPKGVCCSYMTCTGVSVHDLVRFYLLSWWSIHVGSCACEFRSYAMSGHRAWCAFYIYHVDELLHERCNSSALAMELHLSCTNPLMWWYHRNLDYLLSTLNPYAPYVCFAKHTFSLKCNFCIHKFVT